MPFFLETVSKFFRSSQKTGSLPNTPKISKKEDFSFVRYTDDDNLSLASMDSISISTQASISSNQIASVQEKTLEIKADENLPPTSSATASVNEQINNIAPTTTTENEIYIGTIYNQHLIAYTARLVASKFLLSGNKHELISDDLVRVSIKSLALLVIGNCVRYCPEILRFKLTNDQPANFDASVINVIDEKDFDTETIIDNSEIKLEFPINSDDRNKLLDIKDDHFGESAFNYKDFLSPLSKSVDTFMLTQSHALDCDNTTTKLNINLTNYLSKSEIIETKSFDINSICDTVHCDRNISNQCIQDILLYYNNDDPVLRGNVQTIIGNVLVSVMGNYKSYSEFCELYQPMEDERNFLQLNLMLAIIVKVSVIDFHCKVSIRSKFQTIKYTIIHNITKTGVK